MIAIVTACMVLLAGTASAQDVRAVIADASRAMGVVGLESIAIAGNAAYGNLGQSRTISFRLASTPVANFVQVIDFAHAAMHTTGLAGGPAIAGNPAPGVFETMVTPADGWAGQLDIWTSPWGFLIGASMNRASVKNQKVDGTPFKVVTWTPPFKAPSGQSYTVVGYVNAEGLVERVETWVEHPIFGDMHVENFFSNYQDVGGVKVPAKMAQRKMGMETFVAAVNRANINPANLSSLMASVGAPQPPAPRAPTVTSDKLADSVYRLTGTYAVLAVGLKDFVVVAGGGSTCGMNPCSPQESEKLGLAMLAEVKRLFPGKPVKYLVSTHPHFDHAAMLPPFAAEGVTIVTDDQNRYFIEQSLSQPRTLVGDSFGKSKKKPVVEGVEEMLVLGDATRSVEVHHLVKIDHSDGMVVVFLPKEKLLFAGDIDVPAPGEPPSPSLLALFQNLDRLKLDFDRYLTTRPDPAQPISRAELVARVQQADR